MNWIIKNIKKLKFHTNLQKLFEGEWINTSKYNWFISDLDFMTDTKHLPLNFNHNYFILNPSQLQEIINSDVQIIWGSISAIPIGDEIIFDTLPFIRLGKWKSANLELCTRDNCF